MQSNHESMGKILIIQPSFPNQKPITHSINENAFTYYIQYAILFYRDGLFTFIKRLNGVGNFGSLIGLIISQRSIGIYKKLKSHEKIVGFVVGFVYIMLLNPKRGEKFEKFFLLKLNKNTKQQVVNSGITLPRKLTLAI